MKMPKVFDIDYLINEELTDDDLHNLFDKHSLVFSLIIAEYHFLEEYTNDKKIFKDCKADKNWINGNHFYSIKHREKFANKIMQVAKNVFKYSDFTAKRWADDWMFHYGFSIRQHNR